MGRIHEIDKLKYGCSLCFTDIGAGPLVQFTTYSGMSRDDVEWTCEVCCCTSLLVATVNQIPEPEQSSEQLLSRTFCPWLAHQSRRRPPWKLIESRCTATLSHAPSVLENPRRLLECQHCNYSARFEHISRLLHFSASRMAASSYVGG